MYFVLGSTLEYIRNVEHKIIIPCVVIFGLLKISVRYFILKVIDWYI